MQGSYSAWKEDYEKHTITKGSHSGIKRCAEGEPSVNRKKKG